MDAHSHGAQGEISQTFREASGPSPASRGGIVGELAAAGFTDAKEIGRGGFGVVYRCHQTQLNRVVAVKVLTGELGDDRARFVREEQAMARLTGHPNIVAVLQVGETPSNSLFLVMPFCARGCWQARISRLGVLSLDEVLRVGAKIAGALESAHRLEIVHRDVKPANILLTEFGEPALCDFGIARTGQGFKTATGMFVGSPAYTAPELLRGAAPSRASDVYGLGASLFAGLTGHAAFERRAGEKVVAQFLRIATEQPPDLSEFGIPADAVAAVKAAMDRNAENRPTALELGELIQQVQAHHGLAVDEMVVHGSGTMARPAPRLPHAASPRGRASRGRVPALPTAIVGRETELAQLREFLGTSRLATLTGTGGVGKTTLATAAATGLADDFPDGVWLVELAELRGGELLVEAIATALGLRDQSGRPLFDVLVEVLAPSHALLILDNCEHLVDDAAKLVDTLLRDCPQLRILATSREVLDVTGEAVLPLSPMAVPDPETNPTVRTLAEYDAVALFLARAREAVAGFTLTEANAPAVGWICARLEGLPLAIELAAARLRALSVEQIADGLADRYSLLSRARRGAATRQQTLTDCIDWSYRLCSQVEQQFWTQLSVFSGTFEFSAARHISARDIDAGECVDMLCALVDKSILIRTQREGGTVGFRFLDALRDYGEKRLTEEQRAQLAGQHARYYHQLLGQAGAEWFGPRQIGWLQRLTWEIPNIRKALEHNLKESPAAAIDMIAVMCPIWTCRGMLSEARRWLELGVAALPAQPSTQRTQALSAAALVALYQGDPAAVRDRVSQTRRDLEVVDDARGRALTDFVEGYAALIGGELEHARQCCERALAATGDFSVQLPAMVLMGWLLEGEGASDEALSWFEKALALAESCGDSIYKLHALASTGTGRWRAGEPQRAEQVLHEGLRITRLIKDPWTGAQYLEALSWIVGSTGNPRRAVVLMAAASAISRASGATSIAIAAIAGGVHDECEQQAREQLGRAEYEEAWAEGSALTFEDAVAVALAEHL